MSKILYFDDEPFITNLLIDNLRINFGWHKDDKGEIVYVETPKQLFSKLDDEPKYDLIILDIMVPISLVNEVSKFSAEDIEKMQNGQNSGVVFAEKIRTLSGYENVPILFISARRKPDTDIGKYNYLEKPAFASEVDEKMRQLLKLETK